MDLDIGAFVGGLLGALLGLFGGYLKYKAEIEKIRAQYRSANRKTWMNRVIEKIVDYVAAIKHENNNKEAITRFHIELELLLNPTDEDSEIKGKKNTIIQELDNIEKLDGDIDQSIKKIVNLTKDILSHEWEMIKRNE
ncbi:MAG: hypothetical protein ABFS02_06015 [Pseudomonadota bacterium]